MTFADEIISIFDDVEVIERLKYIKQLGSASLIFKQGNHSRYDHSIGALRICERKLSIINANSLTKYQLSNKKIKSILTYALLHDVGHMALSHEMEALTGIHHENLTKSILQSDQILLIIKKLAIQNEFSETCFELKTQNFVTDILDSPIDCDRFDYLSRDSKYCLYEIHLPIENSISNILNSMRIIEHKGLKRVSIHENAVDDVIYLIKCRMEMHDKIYSCPESIALRFIISLISNYQKNKITNNPIFNFSNSLHTTSFLDEFLNFKDDMIYEWIASLDPVDNLSFDPKNILNPNLKEFINFKHYDISTWEHCNASTYNHLSNYESQNKIKFSTTAKISLDNYLSHLRYNDLVVGDVIGDFGWSIDLKSELFDQYSKFIHRIVSVY